MERVVVVGAGFYGLVTAKTYRQITGVYRHGTSQDHELYADEIPACFTTPKTHTPASGLLIIDSASDLGGTWASERLYPNLLSQNSYGLYEYSDLPLAAAVPTNPEDEAAQFIPGWKINRYLHIWSEKWALKKHIRLHWKVSSISRLPSKEWALEITIAGARSITILCDKLVLATGLTTEPNIPDIPCIRDDLEKTVALPVIHAKDVGEYCRDKFGYEPIQDASHQRTRKKSIGKETITPRQVQSVVVQGGAKSAFDFVHLFASLHRNSSSLHLSVKHNHPVQVHWIIDQDGSGPAWMAPPLSKLPTGKVVASDRAASTRLVGMLSPCVYSDRTATPGTVPARRTWRPWLEGPRLRSLFHNNPLGRAFVRQVWKAVDRESAELAQYRSHDKMERLRPAHGAIDCASSGGIANHAQFWETIRAANVHVHRSRIVAFSGRESHATVHLANGQHIEDVDLVVHATGWKPIVPVQLEPPGLGVLLGLGVSRNDAKNACHHILNDWQQVDERVERKMRRRFPPRTFTSETPSHRYRQAIPPRLFRRMVSPSLVAQGDRSLVVVGMVLTSTVGVVAEVQALWAAAFLTGGLDQPGATPSQTIRTPLAINSLTEECLREEISEEVVWGRLTGSGLDVDAIRYNDVLLRDLGLDPYRAGDSFWRELTAVYEPATYAGIVDEWMSLNNHTRADLGQKHGQKLHNMEYGEVPTLRNGG